MSKDLQLVCVRIRPIIAREKKTLANPEKWDSTQTTLYLREDVNQCFAFDKVINPSQSSRDVYTYAGVDIVKDAMIGINGTVFAYGQTCSGKTYTMMGGNSEPGVISLAVTDVFSHICNTPARDFLVRLRYAEIYNEEIMDLLSGTLRLKIREMQDGEVYLENVSEELVTSPNDVMYHMAEGDQRRHVGATGMNEKSSRSHAICTLIIESKSNIENDDQSVLVSQLNFVDLAGSEKVSQTGASGVRLKEGSHINTSLFALANCINKLSEKSAFIPYRDSKLTRLLQNSIGGNSRTAIICNVTPASIDETISTLRFASRAKICSNKPIINEVVDTNALAKRLDKKVKEVEELKRRLAEQANPLNDDTELRRSLETEVIRLKTQLVKQQAASNAHTSVADKVARRQTWCPRPGKSPQKSPPLTFQQFNLSTQSGFVSAESHGFFASSSRRSIENDDSDDVFVSKKPRLLQQIEEAEESDASKSAETSVLLESSAEQKSTISSEHERMQKLEDTLAEVLIKYESGKDIQQDMQKQLTDEKKRNEELEGILANYQAQAALLNEGKEKLSAAQDEIVSLQLEKDTFEFQRDELVINEKDKIDQIDSLHQEMKQLDTARKQLQESVEDLKKTVALKESEIESLTYGGLQLRKEYEELMEFTNTERDVYACRTPGQIVEKKLREEISSLQNREKDFIGYMEQETTGLQNRVTMLKNENMQLKACLRSNGLSVEDVTSGKQPVFKPDNFLASETMPDFLLESSFMSPSTSATASASKTATKFNQSAAVAHSDVTADTTELLINAAPIKFELDSSVECTSELPVAKVTMVDREVMTDMDYRTFELDGSVIGAAHRTMFMESFVSVDQDVSPPDNKAIVVTVQEEVKQYKESLESLQKLIVQLNDQHAKDTEKVQKARQENCTLINDLMRLRTERDNSLSQLRVDNEKASVANAENLSATQQQMSALQQQVEALTSQLKNMTGEHKSTAAINEQLREEKSQIQGTLTASEEQLSAKQQQMSALQQQVKTLTSQLENMTGEVRSTAAVNEQLREEKSQIQETLTASKEQLSAIQQQMSALQQQVEMLTSQLKNMTGEFKSAAAINEQLREENSRMQQILTDRTSALKAQFVDTESELSQTISELKVKLHEVESRLERQKLDHTEEAKEDATAAEAFKEESSDEVLELEAVLSQLREENSSLQQRLADKSNVESKLRECAVSEEQLSATRQRMSALQQQVETLTTQLENVSGERKSAAAINEQLREKQSNMQETLTVSEKQLSVTQQQMSTFQQQVETLTCQLENVSGEHKNAAAINEQLRAEKSKIQETLTASKEQLSATQQQMSALQQQVEMLTSQLKNMTGEFKSTAAINEQLREENSRMQQTLTDRTSALEAQLGDTESELSQTISKLKVKLREVESQLERQKLDHAEEIREAVTAAEALKAKACDAEIEGVVSEAVEHRRALIDQLNLKRDKLKEMTTFIDKLCKETLKLDSSDPKLLEKKIEDMKDSLDYMRTEQEELRKRDSEFCAELDEYEDNIRNFGYEYFGIGPGDWDWPAVEKELRNALPEELKAAAEENMRGKVIKCTGPPLAEPAVPILTTRRRAEPVTHENPVSLSDIERKQFKRQILQLESEKVALEAEKLKIPRLDRKIRQFETEVHNLKQLNHSQSIELKAAKEKAEKEEAATMEPPRIWSKPRTGMMAGMEMETMKHQNYRLNRQLEDKENILNQLREKYVVLKQHYLALQSTVKNPTVTSHAALSDTPNSPARQTTTAQATIPTAAVTTTTSQATDVAVTQEQVDDMDSTEQCNQQ